MNNKSNKFKDLQSKWYDKLKRGGFKDIEQEDGNIKTWSGHVYRYCKTQDQIDIKTDYYRLAGQFLHEYKFQTPTEKFLWKNHSEGVSLRSIARLLAKKGIKTNKDALNAVLKKLVDKMKKGILDE